MKRLSKEDIRDILSKRFDDDEFVTLSKIPSPNSFKDINRAALRIKKAIDNGEKITIVGDYDVDGVVSSVIMREFFDDIGIGIDLIIPNRFRDGYGINEKLLDRIDADLIITVDNGISALKAAEVCKMRGIDLIITDHHTVPDTIPDAYAIVNPKQSDCNFPSSEICGAQVAWYLVAQLKTVLNIKYDLSKFLDILALAIVADMMELKGMNRVMVKKGFIMINQSKRAVFRAVKKFFRKDSFKSDDISFLLSPIINSSGRIEDASLSYELLRSTNEIDAYRRLEYIVSLNNDRKDIELNLFGESLVFHNKDANIIVAWGENWHQGVIGIVAARLVRKFHKPAIVFSINDGVAKGSARSIGNINILELISAKKEFLMGYGGHKGAAGMSIRVENLEQFKNELEELSLKIDKKDFIENEAILGEIDPSCIDFELLDILESFEPYGQKNPQPSFILKNAFVKHNKLLGANANHQKLILESEDITIESLYFNFDTKIYNGEIIDIVCSISKNEFRGLVTPQVLVKEVLSSTI